MSPKPTQPFARQNSSSISGPLQIKAQLLPLEFDADRGEADRGEPVDALPIDDMEFEKGLAEQIVDDAERVILEMLQLAVLAPKYAILDETDSGLDIDALKDVGDSIAALRASEEGRSTGFLIITHYPRILSYVVPDVVHVMIDGRIVKTGGHDLAHRIEREGYDKIREEVAGGVA